MQNKLYKKLIIGAFLTVPIFSSLISTIHAIDLFSLGNMYWMAVCLALVFELGQISSLLTLAILDKINKFMVWSIFIVLAVMQILGNVYYTFDFISKKLVVEPAWLNSALELMNKIASSPIDPITGKFILALVIGIPIPLISIAFLKSLVDYINVNDLSFQSEKQIVQETPEDINETKTDTIQDQNEKIPDVINNTDDIEDLDEDIDRISKEYQSRKYIDDLWQDAKLNETISNARKVKQT